MKKIRIVIASVFASGFLITPTQALFNASTSTVGKVAETEISTCIASNPNLLVQIVVDESRSLLDTDPSNVRAEVIADAVVSISQIAEGDVNGTPRKVMISIDNFADDYIPWIDWTTLDSESAISISDLVRKDLPAKTNGTGTDHSQAMLGARKSLSEGVSKFDVALTPCRILMMFTDGKLDVDGNENEKAIKDLCAPNGIMDGLRSDKVSVVNVLLFDKAKNTYKIEPSDRAYLQSLSEGSGESEGATTQCGAVPISSRNNAGLYLEGNADALSAIFARTIALSAGATEITGLVGSPIDFYIDSGVDQFKLVAFAPQGATLISPNAIPFDLNQGKDSGRVTSTWASNTVTATLSGLSDGDLGKWTLTRSGQEDDAYLFLYTNIALSTDQDAKLISLQESVVSGKVTRNGKIIDLSAFDLNRSMQGTLIRADQTEKSVDFTLNDDGTFKAILTPPDGVSSVKLRISLKLMTIPYVAGRLGQQLTDITQEFIFPISLSADFPSVSPATGLKLTDLVYKKSKSTGTLTLTGSKNGETKVCPSDIAAPSGASPGTFEITLSENSCISLKAGETKELEVAFDFADDSKRIEGQYSGVIPLEMRSTNSVKQEYLVPYTFASVVPYDKGKAGGIALLLMLLGVLIPMVILYGLNQNAARLSLSGLQMARVPVSLTKSASGISVNLIETDGVSDSFLTTDDFQYIPSELDREKSWSPGGETISAHAPKNPFGSITARVTPLNGESVISMHHPINEDGGSWAGSPLNLQGFLYLLLNGAEVRGNKEGEPVRGQLVAFLKPSTTGAVEQVSALSGKARLGENWDRGFNAIASFVPVEPKAPKKPKKGSETSPIAASTEPQFDEAWGTPNSNTSSVRPDVKPSARTQSPIVNPDDPWAL